MQRRRTGHLVFSMKTLATSQLLPRSASALFHAIGPPAVYCSSRAYSPNANHFSTTSSCSNEPPEPLARSIAAFASAICEAVGWLAASAAGSGAAADAAARGGEGNASGLWLPPSVTLTEPPDEDWDRISTAHAALPPASCASCSGDGGAAFALAAAAAPPPRLRRRETDGRGALHGALEGAAAAADSVVGAGAGAGGGGRGGGGGTNE